MFIVKIELSENEDNTSAKFTAQTEKESFKEDNELLKNLYDSKLMVNLIFQKKIRINLI